ncbi:MAG TPA: CDP-alcohol phosphatidyltransferase family protein [Vicinamibacterales bacterium]|nr:CDP-alcohol phosphatidyltransferase family protein [Vicinamibacterales bacterium]
MVRAVPRRVTPNQITLCGHVCIWAAGAVALMASAPGSSVLAILAAGYTVFNLADIVDGMYARHSGQTSRLGELLDHGLDPFGTALVPLTYGIVMREPAWLVLSSTAVVAYLQFLTFLHGYRVGYVVPRRGARRSDVADAPRAVRRLGAGLVAIAFIAGALFALPAMRGLLRRPADLAPLALLLALILAWHAFGALDVRVTGVLLLFTSAYEMMLVTSSRLRRLTLALWDVPFVAALVAAAGLSMTLHAGAGVQNSLAGALSVYALARSAAFFFRTVAAVYFAAGV